jgi:hypothetical protein
LTRPLCAALTGVSARKVMTFRKSSRRPAASTGVRIRHLSPELSGAPHATLQGITHSAASGDLGDSPQWQRQGVRWPIVAVDGPRMPECLLIQKRDHIATQE